MVQGNIAAAISHYRLALDLDPEYHEAHLGLAVALAARRKIVQAVPHFRKAAESPDREIREAAEQALRRHGVRPKA